MITPDIWERVLKRVVATWERSGDKRAGIIRSAAQLSEFQRTSPVFPPAGDPVGDHVEEPESTPLPGDLIPGERLGAYEIVREIGRGGMGAVYLAAQVDRQFEKNVAVKVLNRGTDTDEVLWRFKSERPILSRLEHPNIARLIDAGTTSDSRPYFVMEYVDGVGIAEYCRAKKLSVAARVKLFTQVCSAVHFSHRNLIIHRNLKPGNVLVTADGEAKVLDFGVAKLLSPRGEGTMTLTDQQWLTPGYASPEQIQGEPATTATDVYSLGTSLYELLVGESPHRFGTPHPLETELFEVIVEQKPPRPSSLAKSFNARFRLRGDLDCILQKALRKEPDRRYSGVSAFMDDLWRYLDNRPVRACPDTFVYRTSKFIRRNKIGAAVGGLVLLALISGITATVWQARQANLEKSQADRRFAEVRKLAHTVLFDYHDSIATLPGSTAVRERMVRDAVEYLDNLARDAGNNPELMRELAIAYQKVGQIQGNSYYANLGDTNGGMVSYTKSLEIRQKLLAADPANRDLQDEAATSYEGLGDMNFTAGDRESGLQNYARSLELREQLIANAPGNVFYRTALADLYKKICDIKGTDVYPSLNQTPEALTDCRKAQELFESLAAADPRNPELKAKVANVSTHLGTLSRTAGDSAAMMTTQRKAVAMLEELAAAHLDDQNYEWQLLSARNLLRTSLEDNEQLSEAVDQARRTVKSLEKMVEKDPGNNILRRNLFANYNALGKNLLATGNASGALENHRQALTLGDQMLAADSNNENKSNVSSTLRQLAQAQVANKEYRLALQNYRRALALSDAVLATDPSSARAKEDYSSVQAEQAIALAATGNFEGAIGAFNKALPLAEEVAKTNSKSRARLAQRYFEIGRIHMQFAQLRGDYVRNRKGEWQQARDSMKRSLTIWQAIRDKNALTQADVTKMDQTARELAVCEGALR